MLPCLRTLCVLAWTALVAFPATAVAANHIAPGATPLGHDVPAFCSSPTIRSVKNGAWSDAATWSPARVPGAGDAVSVAGGTSVLFDRVSDQALDCVSVSGALSFRTDASTRLTVGTLLIRPEGSLEIGRAGAPLPGNVTAEIVIADLALDLGSDPEQTGTGVLGFGRVSLIGASRTPTWARVAVDLSSVASSLTLATAVNGWRSADELIIPKTERATDVVNSWLENERVTVRAVSADGKTVTLTAATKYPHPGSLDADGDGRPDRMVSVANVSRNIVIRSANPAGTRGHVFMTHTADVDIQYVAFVQLGRSTNDEFNPTTNHIGRYPLHLHHLIGKTPAPASGFQASIVGNAILGDGTRRWGIAVHKTHAALISDNIIYDVGGAGLMVEDGDESYNHLLRNWVTKIFGDHSPIYGRRPVEFGHEGSGLWVRNPTNRVEGNVVSNVLRFGIVMTNIDVGDDGNIAVPVSPGSHETKIVNVKRMPLASFTDNEVFGAIENGVTFWEVGGHLPRTDQDTPSVRVATAPSAVDGTVVWNHKIAGIETKHSSDIQIVNSLIVGDGRSRTGISLGAQHRLTAYSKVSNGLVVGNHVGVSVPDFGGPLGAREGTWTLSGLTVSNVIDVLVTTVTTDSTTIGEMPQRLGIIDSLRLSNVTSQRVDAIRMSALFTGSAASRRNVSQLDRVFVKNFDAVAGDDFQVFYNEQSGDSIMPASSDDIIVGSPEVGLTNAANWSRYRIATAGAIAPCSETRAQITGLVCRGVPMPPALPLPPRPPFDLRLSR